MFAFRLIAVFLPAIAFFCGFFDKWPRCGWSLSKGILFLALIADSWARQVVAIFVFLPFVVRSRLPIINFPRVIRFPWVVDCR